MKYKVGDKVRIKSKEWWNARPKNTFGSVSCGVEYFTKEMTEMCGREVWIERAFSDENKYWIKEFSCIWTDEMFEDVEQSENTERSKREDSKQEDKQLILSEELVKDLASIISKHNLSVKIEERTDGIFVKPIEKEEDDLPIDTPCMCFLNGWMLRYYAGNKKCFIDGMNSNSLGEGKPVDSKFYKVIIPFSLFDVNDIESSLKYNIVK